MQLEQTKWKLNDVNNKLRAVQEDHTRLMASCKRDSHEAAAAQRRCTESITKLRAELQALTEQHRGESAAATEAAAEERCQLLNDMEKLSKYACYPPARACS